MPSLNDRPNGRRQLSWLVDTTRMVDQLRRPDMGDFDQAGALLVSGWISA